MPQVSEQEMRIYLLGGLSPERQTEVAALVHNDAELQEELLAVKEELFDQYLAGSLTKDEQLYFETHFLSTESGQQKLHFARLLHNYRDDQSPAVNSVPAPVTPVRDSARFHAPAPFYATFHRHPVYVASLTVIAGLLVTLVFWATRSSRMDSVTQNVPTLVLTAGTTRSGGTMKELQVPARNDRVNVELELTKSDFKKYKTQLFRENQALESQEELQTIPRNAHYVVTITVPGDLLTPGEYQLQLSGVPDSGQPTYIDSYSFRVKADNPPESGADREQTTR